MTPADVLRRIESVSALVVGDVCLDRWCVYDPDLTEPSRETGLPRTAVVRTETTAGAAGTVANNLAALGARRVSVLGFGGDDGHGLELRRALERARVSTEHLIATETPTFTYTKLLNAKTGAEDLGRVDFLPASALPAELERMLANRLRETAAGFDAILVSDQAETETEGTITASIRRVLEEIAQRHPDKVIWVDSRMRSEKFRRVIVKPNEREASEACRRIGLTDFRALRDVISHPLMMVTHADRGALVLDGEREVWAPALRVPNPVDICGAGDSFSAGAALALAAGASALESARMGNLVASVTIRKKGTGTASPDEVLGADRDDC
jgi:rfaE bifunctional protein kinase chain/domain